METLNDFADLVADRLMDSRQPVAGAEMDRVVLICRLFSAETAGNERDDFQFVTPVCEPNFRRMPVSPCRRVDALAKN